MGGSTLNREDYKSAIPQLSAQLDELLKNNVIINRTVITLSEGKVSDLSNYLGYFQSLTTGYFQAIAGDIEYLSSREAYINHLKSDIASFGYLTAETADLRYATISNLNAAVARIGDLEADHVSVSDLTAATGRIGALEADHVSVNDLAATNADVAHLKVGDLTIGGVTVNIYDLAIAIKNSAMASGTTWYKVSASTPTAPVVFDPTSDGWSQTEPAYVGGTTDHLYSCVRVVYADDDPLGTRHFQWSDVHMIQSWEAAKSAYSYADDANTAAVSAKTSADSALRSLSEVEDVVGVLEWITAHGTMTSQTGETFDANKVYFIVDPNGDYEVSGTKYSLVTNPVASDINSYYCLSVDESIENYVGTHLAVTSEGLWLIPEENATPQSSSKKILIAVGGTGHTYETAGTYIIEKVDGADKVLASFAADGVQLGQMGETHATITREGQIMEDWLNNAWFTIVLDPAEAPVATSSVFTGDGTTTVFDIGELPTRAKVRVDDVLQTEGEDYTIKGNIFTFNSPPESGASIRISYSMYSNGDLSNAYFSLGARNEIAKKGFLSVAEGYLTKASGIYSHAEGSGTTASNTQSHAEGLDTVSSGLSSHSEGYNTEASGYASHAEGSNTVASGRTAHAEGLETIASGDRSHAEGDNTEASGNRSHAQNYHTRTGYDYQTAIGKYNDNQQDNAFEIGNGTSNSNRSNAFAVDWDGNVTPSGQVKTSFKSSVATGSYGSAQTTIPNFVNEVRYSSGCAGSVSIGTAYTKDGVTIPAGWYNFMYMPHRTGGKNGQVDPDAIDNVEYGNLLLFGFANGSGRYDITIDGGVISKLVKLITSEDVRKTPTTSTHTKNVGKIAANTYKNCETSTITPTAAQSGLTPCISGWDVQGTGTASCQIMGVYLSGNATNGYVGHIKLKNDSTSQIGDVTIEVRLLWV